MIAIFDLDGTLADIEHRRKLIPGPGGDWLPFHQACPFDKPIWPMIKLLRTLHFHHDWDLEIWTGRSDAVRHQTEQWITDHVFNGAPTWRFKANRVMHLPLKMRAHDDHRTDVELKQQWLNELRAEGSDVAMAFDDRARVVKMWRENGILCHAVAEGDF